MSQLTDTFTGIANAIRNKTGSSSAFTPAQMITEIGNIQPPISISAIEPFKYASSTITSYNGNEDLILDNAFYNCSTLSTISFPECSYIGSYAFQSCSKLVSLYLLTSTVPSLQNSNAFNYTPLSAGGSGTIYVKSSLEASFKAATNWRILSNRIVGM